jgi:hypothetical protein
MERRAEHLLAEMGFNRSIRSSMVFEGELATDDPTAGQRIVNGWKNSSLSSSYRLDRTKIYRFDK